MRQGRYNPIKKTWDYIDFNPEPVPPVDCKEGRVKWNKDYYTVDICTGLGPINQVGQELYKIVFNDSGSEIGDGKAVYLSGLGGGYPTITKAIANTHDGIQGAVYITTMVIPDNSVGVVTQFGRVQNIDTSGFTSAGATLYISPTVAGDLTETRPAFPDYEFVVGAVEVKDSVNGVLDIDIRADVDDTFVNYWNGSFRESFDFRVTESGGTVTGTLTPTNGHLDMTMIFSDGFTTLDTDPGATVDLTPYVGTDTDPAEVYVYITRTSKILQAALPSTDWPASEHIKVARLVLQSAASIGTRGALRNQNINDHLVDTNTSQGHNSHIGERIRAIEAEWLDGALATMDAGGQYITVTSGRVYQMHLQNFPAQSMPTDDIHVVNDPDAAYAAITDLDSITKDSTGALLSTAKYYSLVVWGVANKSGEASHMMLNLPSGFYSSESAAMSDALGYANFTVPKKFKGTGFLIARFVMQYNNGWIYGGASTGYQDLRGFIPNSTAGSGAGSSGITTFLGLTDTPISHVAGQILQGKAGATAVEYTDSPTLAELNVDNINLNGNTISATGDLILDPTGDVDLNTNNIDRIKDASGAVDATPVTALSSLDSYWRLDGDLNNDPASNNPTITVTLDSGSEVYDSRGVTDTILLASQYLTASGSYKGITGSNPRTYNFWVKIDPSLSGTLINLFGNGDFSTAGSFFAASKAIDDSVFIFFGNGNVTTTASIADGEWHMISVTVPEDGTFGGAAPGDPKYGDIRVYCDAGNVTLSGANLGTSVATGSVDNFAIGRTNTAVSLFQGNTAEFAIFDDELSQPQLEVIYEAQRQRLWGVDGDIEADTVIANDVSVTGDVVAKGNADFGEGGFTYNATTDATSLAGDVSIDGNLAHNGSFAGFYGATPITVPSVTGSRGGNAALASLLTALENLGLIIDNTTA